MPRLENLAALRRSFFWGLWLVSGVACERKEAIQTAASATPSSMRHGQSVRAEGERFEPTATFAIGTEGETSWRITLALGPTDCASLRARYPEHAASAGSLDLWFVQPVGVHGERQAWSLRGGYANGLNAGRSLIARGAMVDSVTANETSVLAQKVEFALQEREESGRLYRFDGSLAATNCGRVVRPEVDRPQAKFVLRIGSDAVPIHGASLRVEGTRHYLRLTRAPHRCDSAFTEGYDFYADLALEGAPPRALFVALLGDVFPESATGSKGKESFSVKAQNWNGGTGNVVLDLAGTLDAGGFIVEFQGEVSALRCTVAAP